MEKQTKRSVEMKTRADRRRKKIILALIKDDIRSSKFLAAFHQLGIRTDDYDLDLADAILELMGVKDSPANECLFCNYMRYSNEAKGIDTARNSPAFDQFVCSVYHRLRNDILELRQITLPSFWHQATHSPSHYQL